MPRIQPIEITDLNLLKIKKVKPWSIIFSYGEKEYLLHGGSELGEGEWQDFYERIVDKKGRYELKPLGTVFGEEIVQSDYIRITMGSKKKHPHRPIVYNQIDKEYFVYRLTKRGIAIGIMQEQVLKNKKIIEEKEKEIRMYEQKISELRREIYKL